MEGSDPLTPNHEFNQAYGYNALHLSHENGMPFPNRQLDSDRPQSVQAPFGQIRLMKGTKTSFYLFMDNDV